MVAAFFAYRSGRMVYAAIDEITQSFIPGRYPDVLDFAADAAGLWTAILVYVAAKGIHASRRMPQSNQSLELSVTLMARRSLEVWCVLENPFDQFISVSTSHGQMAHFSTWSGLCFPVQVEADT